MQKLARAFKSGFCNFKLQDVISYKMLLILDFTLIFLFLLYSGSSYTTLKLWLEPPIKHRVEITTTAAYHRDVIPALVRNLHGQELVVFRDGFVAYVPLVSKDRVLVRYAAASVSELVRREDLMAKDIALILAPEDSSLYEEWLGVYRAQGDAVLF